MNQLAPRIIVLFLTLLCIISKEDVAIAADSKRTATPNIILMFADDQGYADIGVFGAEGYETPNLDRMAAEGARFTDFYVSSPVCSASRAALLTGCYHARVGMHGALGPSSLIGLHHDETTIADLLKEKGYATAIYGKWHLGRPEELLPTNHGFDEYLGIPYSNDMWPYHPNVRHLPMGQRLEKWPHLPLIEDQKVIDKEVTPEEQRDLTTRFTERAVNFINQNAGRPFFLYLPHPMPHVPLFTSNKFEGKTKQGAYGDVIAEIDWSMGQIIDALKKNQIDDNTLVIYTSDNGPWLSYGDHAGSAGPLREGKGTCWEGGIRVPFIARWPGQIPPGLVVSEPAATIDLLPTIAFLTNSPLPERKIDGQNIWPLLSGQENARSPHEALFFYYKTNQLQAMRSGKWKLMFPHTYRTLAGRRGGAGGIPVNYENHQSGLELYNLNKDIGETTNVADQHPEIVAKLSRLADRMRSDLGDSLTKTSPTGSRAPAKIDQ
ncbi:MAG: sulfatase [Verrucomicrobiota bacterium]